MTEELSAVLFGGRLQFGVSWTHELSKWQLGWFLLIDSRGVSAWCKLLWIRIAFAVLSSPGAGSGMRPQR